MDIVPHFFAYCNDLLVYSIDMEIQEDEKFMREAIREAEAAALEDEVPVGAVLVCRGRIIAKGHNMTERLTDATQALGGKYLNECTLYVTVEPCPMCAGALNWSQLGRLVYGAEDPKRGCTLFSPNLLHPKTQVTKGILAQECSRIVTEYFRKKRM